MKPRGGGEQPAVRKGPWVAEEDEVLLRHVQEHGPREWSSIRSKGLLPRTGKSCRLRWVNKLRPDLKTGCRFSPEEERVVIDLQAQFGNKWARIATYLPGRTDNDVKNFWSTRQKRLARLLRTPVPRRRPSRQGGGASSSHAHEMPIQKETTTLHHHQIGESSSSSQAPRPVNQLASARFPAAYYLPSPPVPALLAHAGAERGSPSAASQQITALLPFVCDAGNMAAGVHPPARFPAAHVLPPPPPLLAHVLPPPPPLLAHAGAERGSPSSAAPTTTTTTALLPFVGGGDGNMAAGGVDPLVFVDPVVSPEPLEVVPPDTFFALHDDYVHAGRAMERVDMCGVRFDDLPPETFDFFELPDLPPYPPPFPPPPPSPSSQLY
ncbi:hypothetical protein HU200_065727 [Digitaria exilis]|uniref:Uncharacterized protein n=1 Tax=Digitaria exilis TaxID=1010633 RepID=A0A834ZXZ9_9POAL|nr:hypothetical protein HU200_065727 [Digitaria exilis]